VIEALMMLVPLIAVLAAVVLYRLSLRRERTRLDVPAIPKPLNVADSKLYVCRDCGCEWRKWSDGFWSLADGEQRPAECCRCSNMDEVTR